MPQYSCATCGRPVSQYTGFLCKSCGSGAGVKQRRWKCPCCGQVHYHNGTADCNCSDGGAPVHLTEINAVSVSFAFS